MYPLDQAEPPLRVGIVLTSLWRSHKVLHICKGFVNGKEVKRVIELTKRVGSSLGLIFDCIN